MACCVGCRWNVTKRGRRTRTSSQEASQRLPATSVPLYMNSNGLRTLCLSARQPPSAHTGTAPGSGAWQRHWHQRQLQRVGRQWPQPLPARPQCICTCPAPWGTRTWTGKLLLEKNLHLRCMMQDIAWGRLQRGQKLQHRRAHFKLLQAAAPATRESMQRSCRGTNGACCLSQGQTPLTCP